MATNHLPQVAITLSPSAPSRVVTPGTPLNFVSTAKDADGDLLEHWVEIKNPAGQWSWEGWLTTPEWQGDLNGDASLSIKSVNFTFNELGTWYVRTTANDEAQKDQYQISNEIAITVTSAPTEPPTVPALDLISVSIDGAAPIVATVGAKLTLAGAEVYTFDKKGDYALKITPPVPVVVPPVEPPDDDGGATGDAKLDWPMTPEAISERLGKKWDGTNDQRKKNPMSVTQTAPAGVDPRIAHFEFGKILTDWNNFWSTTFNGLMALAGNVIPFRAQDFAAYSGAAATAARPDLTGFIPDPDLSWAPVDGVASCMHRSQSCLSNEALVGTLSGKVTSLGTQTSRDPGTWRPVLNIPNFTITAICSTSQTELAIAVGFDPRTKKGRIAYIGVQAKYLGSHTMHETCKPNQGSFSVYKLLGVRDLPFDWPSAVSAASNGQWIGPSQTANQDLGQIDMTHSWARDSMRDEGENDNTPWGWIFATKAVVTVVSKRAGKVAVIDLSKFVYQVRQDYCAHDDQYVETILAAEAAGNYPPTFDEAKDLEPVLNAVYDLPTAQTVIMVPKLDRWSNDYWKAIVGCENGELVTIDVSPLLSRYSWQAVGPGGIIGKTNLGGNICHLTWGRYDDDWVIKPHMPNNGIANGYINSIIATIRDKSTASYVWSFRDEAGLAGRDLSTVNGRDLIGAYVNDRTNQVILYFTDKLITFTIAGVSVPVVHPDTEQSWYYAVEGNNEGWNENPELAFPEGAFIFAGTDANTN